MSRIRKMATAAATFSVALGIGFVMQNGDALAGRFGAMPQDAGPLPQAQVAAPRTIVTVPETELLPVAQVVMQPAAAPAMSLPVGQLQGLAALPAVTASFAVQLGRVLAPKVAGGAVPAPEISTAVAPVIQPETLAPAPAAVVSADIATQAGQQAEVTTAAFETVAPVPAAPPAAATLPPDCTATLQAEAAPMGMADLTLSAPCAPGQAIMIHHDGMMFTALTDGSGSLQVTVPALSVSAVFVADLGQGQGAVGTAHLPDVALLDRAVVQGRAGMGLALHAFAFGAAFGGPGHVWQDAPGSVGDAAGFLTQLGATDIEGSFVAQVYTSPLGTAGDIDLTTEVAVNADNCDQGLALQTLQLSPGGPVFVRDLSMDMPDCTAVGEYVVLTDGLLDLTMASN